MIKAIIVDDEPAAGEVLKNLIKKHTSHITVSAICFTVKQAIEQVELHKPNILFLDIELGDGSGFEVLESIDYSEVRVVFVTAYEHYAIQAIKHNAFDYILKPILPEELNKTIDKIFEDELKQSPYPKFSKLLKQLAGEEEKIAIPTRKGLVYYLVKDIIYIAGEGSYARVYLKGGNQDLVTKKVKDFEEKLEEDFMRIHKSYLVNKNHIEGFLKEDGGYLMLSNKTKLPISNSHKQVVINELRENLNII